MSNNRNKLIAFILGISLSVFSWVILFISVILKLTTFTELGIFNLNLFGFFIANIVLTIYSIFILFKINQTAYFPILIVFLHIIALEGSYLSIIFVAIDLIILVLLNTQKTIKKSPSEEYMRKQKMNATKKRTNIDEENVFDVEFTTKDNEE